MNTYLRLPVTFARGEGVWLWDEEGKRYLDALAGVAVCGLGHCHPALAKALCDQAGTLIHTSNLYHIRKQEQLGTRLTALSGMDNAFFCNSGAEANEAAIKLARLYGHGKNIDLPTIIVMEKSFHGRTMATLTASGNRKVQAGFEPLLTGFARVPYNDLEAVAQVAEHNKNVVAILVEPYQGEGGVNVPQANYLQGLRHLCNQNGWLLMLDEVQCGIGRTGNWFAFQYSGITPDVVTLAKGLGSGVPIGACLAKGIAANVFKPGNHASTFGGNPLACSAALTTLEVIEKEDLLRNAMEVGDFMRSLFKAQLADLPEVIEIRGQGLMIGIELSKPCGELVKEALKKGLLINVTSDKVVRLLPPLVIQRSEAEQVVNILSPIVKEFLAA
ncbi:acetylornithine aminotransferase apoenzyme [Nitrosospira multiformis ATCC 25196]|nr:acetylornithine aminotransferase apoenzyme [Nitrosospira multiformis]SEF50667.1 acetylornithine aminotransferase apoenzyme [Nitrosospira multiformis ATCC 25196]